MPEAPTGLGLGLVETTFDGARPFDGYGPGFFRVGGTVARGAVLVHPGGMAPWGGTDDADALVALAGAVDVVLVGTGEAIAHLPDAFREALEEAGLGVEAMATPAACRTYNVLVGEGRRVAAAVLPV